MSIVIPVWLIWAFGIIGVMAILFFALLGIAFVIAMKNFKLNW